MAALGLSAPSEIPWTIITGAPTTLAGYGITDATIDKDFAFTGDRTWNLGGHTLDFSSGNLAVEFVTVRGISSPSTAESIFLDDNTGAVRFYPAGGLEALNISATAITALNGAGFAGSGADLTNLPATLARRTDTHFVGTTSIALNRGSAALALTGITSIDGLAATATVLATGRTFSVTGDAAGTSATFNGSANASIALALATVATAGTVGSATAIPVITIDGKGRVTTLTSTAVSEPRMDDMDYQPGRTWVTGFDSATADAMWATMINQTYGTDGGAPALSLTVPGTIGSFYLNDTTVRDFEVLVRWRALAGEGQGIQDIQMKPEGRRIDDSNRAIGWHLLTSGNPIVQIYGYKAGASQTSGSSAVNGTDATTYRYSKFRVVGDVYSVKSWLSTAAEPAWQIIERLRSPLGLATSSSSIDNQDFGRCGFSNQYGGVVQMLRITELVRKDSNLITSPMPTVLATNSEGYAVGWYPTKGTGDTADFPSVADRAGDTRAVFHVTKVATNASCFWTQDLWETGPNAFLTRKSPHPQVKFPKAIEVSIWTKGTNVATSGSLASAVVCYQYDMVGNVLNIGNQFYYSTLGPNGAVAGSGGKKGDGTWGWTKTTWRMPLVNINATNRIRVDIGIHDNAATGDLWFSEIQLRAVP